MTRSTPSRSKSPSRSPAKSAAKPAKSSSSSTSSKASSSSSSRAKTPAKPSSSPSSSKDKKKKPLPSPAAATMTTPPPTSKASKKKVPATAASTTAIAGSSKKQRATTRSTKSKSSPFVELPEDTSVESAAETDEEFDEDDLDEFEEGVEVHFVPEPSTFATKLVLRITYSVHFMIAMALVLAAAKPEWKLLNRFTPTVPTDDLSYATAVGHFGTALVLVAAAQSNYDAQKRALQYGMVLHMLNALYAAATVAHWKPSATNAFQFIVMNMLLTGAAMWACYFYVQPESDEAEEEEE